MTEQSMVWDGTSLGDATRSPYDAATEFVGMLSRMLSSDGEGYVLPGYLNSLNVQASSPAAASVDVTSGGAFVKGFDYTNSALNTLVIAANASGQPRIDRIIIRVDWLTQTIRLAVLPGTPAAAPTIPALTQTIGVLWELSLAYIWVANGFASITNVDIHDERTFIRTAAIAHLSSPNMIRNSEFILFEDEARASSRVVLGVWYTNDSANYPTFSAAVRPSQQTRGKAASMASDAAAAGVLEQIVACRPSTVYTVNCLIKPSAAGASVSVYGIGSAAILQQRTIRFVGSWIEEKFTFTTGVADSYLKFTYTGVANQTVVFGQPTLVEGWIKGDFVPVHEFIPVSVNNIPFVGYNSAVFSTGAAVIDLTAASITNCDPFEVQDLQAMLLFVKISDTGSAAANVNLEVATQNNTKWSSVEVGGAANSKERVGQIWVPTSYDRAADVFSLGFRINRTASGVNTLTATVGLLGVYT